MSVLRLKSLRIKNLLEGRNELCALGPDEIIGTLPARVVAYCSLEGDTWPAFIPVSPDDETGNLKRKLKPEQKGKIDLCFDTNSRES